MNLYGSGADEILGRYDAVLGPLIYKQDKQGNVTFVLNGNNQIVEKYTYDAYGTPKVTDGAGTPVEYADHTPRSAIGNRFMYTGREYLQELGIYDYRHRYYLPSIGRFLETDPTGFDAGDMNLFRYCGDDPVDKSDPTGLIENPIGGYDVVKSQSDRPPSYQMADYRDSLITQGLPAGVQRDIAIFEKRMNAGNENVKWTYGMRETWSSSDSFKKTEAYVTAWSILSTPLVEGGKIVGFRNELLVHIRHNTSASAGAKNFGRREEGGEIEHFRDALRAASMANGYGNRHFSSAKDIAARAARGLIGTNTPASAAKSQMESSLQDWTRKSMEDSLIHWDWSQLHTYKEP
jgi:RHS repeat-associated protein